MSKQLVAGVLAAMGLLVATVAGADTGHDGMSMNGGMKMDSNHMSQASNESTTVSTSLTVSDCWIRALPLPAPSAGYFVVHNSGTQQARLTGATSPAFGMVMLHESTQSDGMSKMVMVHDVPVPAGGSLTFKPGGYHAMLEKPVHELVVGSNIELDLAFASGEATRASCVVKPANTVSN